MKTIDKFFVANNVCVPLNTDLRHKQCPNASAAKNIYKSIVEKDMADIEVKNGSSYCWDSCKLTVCPSYVSNRK